MADPYADLDPVSYKAVTGRDKPGSAKPKATPKPSTAPRSPLLDLAHKAVDVGTTALFPIAKMAGPQIAQGINALDSITGGGTSRAITKGMNLMDAPLSAAGATLRDIEEGHNPFDPAHPSPHVQKFKDLIGQYKFGEAAQEYSLANLQATKARAQAGEPVAKYFTQHPTQFGLAAGGLEAINPAYAALGGVGGEALNTARLAARYGAVPTAERFGQIEAAAIREGKYAPAEAGSKANQAARMVANASHYGKGEADKFVADLFTYRGKRLTKAQQMKLVDYIEGERVIPIQGSTAWNRMTPAEQSEARMLTQKRDAYRDYMRKLDKEQVDAGLDPARLWKGDTYFPRKGFALDPLTSKDEEVQETLRMHRTAGPGGPSYRRGTAAENIPSRKYPTHKRARDEGVALNPDWRPSQALWEHIAQRKQNVRLNEGLEKFEDLGLIEPRATSTRTDFAPFTQFGNVRNFGAPLTREGSVHTSLVKLISDMQPAVETRGAPTALSALAKALPFASRQAARFEVTNPIYHPLVNLLRNYGRGGNPIELLKAFLPGADLGEAERAGATLPHVSAMPMGQRVLKYSERVEGPRAFGKRGPTRRLTEAIEHPLNLLSNEPVYKYFEPRMGSAFYKSLRNKGVSEAEAVKRTRMMLGDPEGIAGTEKQLAQAAIFPSWLKSQARLWGGALIRHPEIYAAPHRAVEARNISRGVGPQPSDPFKMIPNIALSNRDKRTGDVEMLPIPHPANRLLTAMRLLSPGEPNKAGMLASFANPALATAAKWFMTEAGKAAQPSLSTLYDKDAPRGERLKQALGQTTGAYTPLRSSDLGVGGSIMGLEPYTLRGPSTSAGSRIIERMFRSPIEMLRYQAKAARERGDDALAKGFDKKADTLYYEMVDRLQARQKP